MIRYCFYVISCLSAWLPLSLSAHQAIVIPRYSVQQYRHDIATLYRDIPATNRVANISAGFLHQPYLLGALGEGPQADIDQQPLFRTDAFDCVSYVCTVMALALGHDFPSFLCNLKKIQYYGGKVDYFNRYHFTDLDWNPSNHQKELTQDITATLCPDCKYGTAMINYSQWYIHHSPETIKHFKPISPQLQQRLLGKFIRHAEKIGCYRVSIAYIPLSQIFNSENQCTQILQNIPTGAIIEIVDKNKDFMSLIGTDSNVTHLGFVIKTPQGIRFRHASKIEQEVVDVSLLAYLTRRYHSAADPSKIGIHVEALNPRFFK